MKKKDSKIFAYPTPNVLYHAAQDNTFGSTIDIEG